MDDKFFAGFNRDLRDADRWRAFYEAQRVKNPQLSDKLPPVPELDGEWLFNEMMASSDSPDPWMFPALQKLKASGKYILAALSNTVIFEPGHPLYKPDFFDHPVKQIFDVFVSSAHVGLRKPDPAIYQFALKQVNSYALDRAQTPRGKELGWLQGVKPQDILFLDDIGENLKTAKKEGFGTVKVNLGRAFEAVDELEKVTGLSLAGDHPRVPIKPDMSRSRARAKPRL